MKEGAMGKTCDCMHHKVVPCLIILLGLVFLLQYFGVLSAQIVDVSWPIIVILIGLNKLMKGACTCC